MRAIADADVARLTPEDRDVMVQYARGVNYFIDTHRGDYSLEFSIPFNSYDPRPWTLTDSMLVGAVDVPRSDGRLSGSRLGEGCNSGPGR